MPILCAAVYLPPKADKDFINEFSEFLAEFVPYYDNILICGDFNIRVYCSSSGQPVSVFLFL